MSVEEKVKAIVVEQLGVSEDEVTLEASSRRRIRSRVSRRRH
jgi:acyl carrier protein